MRHTPRAGFTLIELLVVVAIIAILVSLTAAGVQRVRTTQAVRTAEDVVGKVQTGLDNQWKVIADNVVRDRNPQSRSADFSSLLAYCDNDEDRAAALLAYCRLRQNLPQTAAEVNAASFAVGGVTFRRPPAFEALNGISGNADAVSAALLYVALSQRTIGGNTFASDDATSGAQADITVTIGGASRQVRVYRDGWGNPIAFRRFHRSAELDAPPYSQAGDATKDPLDPRGRLGQTSWANRAAAEAALGITFPPPGATSPPFRNTVPVAFSFGLNKASDNLDGDDILGYRLRAIGARGFRP